MVNLVGTATATEPGVSGGSNTSFAGVRGSNSASGVGVRGFGTANDGIRGESSVGGAGVRGIAMGVNHNGVVGESRNSGNGVLGVATSGTGVFALSNGRGHGLYSKVVNNTDHKVTGGIDGLIASRAGVLGISTSVSVLGLVNPGGWHPEEGLPNSKYSIGVCGAFPSNADQAPLPWDIDWVAQRTGNFPHIGVYGMANVGVLAVTPFAGGHGLLVSNTAGGKAAAFQGNVEIFGALSLTGMITTIGTDCAEQFDLADAAVADQGSVLVADDEGRLIESVTAYDCRVVGVVSGGGDHRPGLILGGNRDDPGRHAAVALIGRVACKVDARYGAIAVGDLLTTSPTAGHAMRVADVSRALGSIIGKALRPLRTGQGMVPILVALQ